MAMSERRRKNIELLRLGRKIKRDSSPLDMPRRAMSLEERKERFARMNDFVTSLGGWVTSLPGDPEVTMECRESSDLPGKLRDAGYELHPEGRGQRLAPDGLVEEFMSGRVLQRRAHAGIVPVERYWFRL